MHYLKFVLLLIVISILSNCTKDTPYTKATIIGYDFTMTPCSGGHIIEIDGVRYQCDRDFTDSINKCIAIFPISINVKFSFDSTKCSIFSKPWVKVKEFKII
jgi:hypothetical protein